MTASEKIFSVNGREILIMRTNRDRCAAAKHAVDYVKNIAVLRDDQEVNKLKNHCDSITPGNNGANCQGKVFKFETSEIHLFGLGYETYENPCEFIRETGSCSVDERRVQ